MEQARTGWALATTVLSYLVQSGVVLLLVFHDFASKDSVVIVSLLIIVYGMSTAQIASESIVSGMRFVTLANRFSSFAKGNNERGMTTETGEHDISLEEITEKERPYTFAGAMFCLFIALIGAVKLVYTLIGS